MRFLVDENLPYDIVTTAIRHGHEATWVRDVLPGAPDAEVLARMRAQCEALVTRDVRFANLVATLSVVEASVTAVVLIREQRLEDIREAWPRLLSSLREFRGIAVVTRDGVRYRRNPR